MRGDSEVVRQSRRPQPIAALISVAVLACGTAIVSPAYADNAAQAAAARTLFDEARQLAADGKYKEACPKFEASKRLEPGAGVMFNLADCYEQIGRTASAWSLFLEVASMSKATSQTDRETAARARAAALEPKLSRLTINGRRGLSGYLGVHDMSGNAMEWIDSCESSNGQYDYCLVAGGSYKTTDINAKCTSTQRFDRSAWQYDIGFRCCTVP